MLNPNVIFFDAFQGEIKSRNDKTKDLTKIAKSISNHNSGVLFCIDYLPIPENG